MSIKNSHTVARLIRIVVATTTALFVHILVSGCSPPPPTPPTYAWQTMQSSQPGALLSVWGFSRQDVYVVGADSREGFGPTALHYDGQTWTRMNTGESTGDLWWVYGVAPDTVFMVGAQGLVLRYTPATRTFTRMTTPGTETIFGVWGANANDVWAVGGNVSGTVSGVVWHFDGTQWQNVMLPEAARGYALFKVWGSSATDIWAVGDNATTLHWDGTTWTLVPVTDDVRGKLLTVHGNGSQRYAVGGAGSGLLLESTGDAWRRIEIESLPRLAGVFAPATGNPVAVGANGTVLHLNATDHMWRVITRRPDTDYDFHAVWVDPTGDIWAVGGQIVSAPLSNGMIFHFGEALPTGPVMIDPDLRRCPDAPGTICTYAGSGEVGFDGDGRPRTESALYWPVDLEFNAENRAYLLDWNNHRVRRVLANDTLETIIGTEIPGDGDDMSRDLMEPGALGTAVALNHPTDLLFQADGRMLLCAWHNHKIRRWDPATGNVFVTVGRGNGGTGDGGPAAMALLKQPSKFEFDPAGNLYIFDQGNLRIRRIGVDGIMTTVAGTGMRGFAGDNGPPAMAMFSLQQGENPEPEGALAADAMGRLYVADSSNHRIRLIDFTANTITTVAGTGMPGFAGDGGPAAMAQLNSPRDIEMGPNGNLYIADTGNHAIRVLEVATGTIRTIVGRLGQYGYAGDRGPVARAQLYRPFGIAFDRAANLYIADTYNNRVRRVQHE